MDITKQNFSENLTKIDELISECDFVSIDCEFTGLYKNRTHELENYEQNYLKTRNNIQQFQILQFGLSLFTKSGDAKFDCYSFNFYIFPTKCIFVPDEQKERYFLCQSTSLAFLVENGFDFNKVIREGISYVPLSQVAAVEEKIKTKIQENGSKTNYIDIESEEDKKFVNEIKKILINFINSDQQEQILPQYNSYYRRIIYETVQKSEYKNTLQISTGKNENKGAIILKKAPPKSKEEEFNSIFIENVGFSLIIKSLIKHQKPLVGHSLFIDLLYIYQSFIEPLPENYEEFKTCIKSCFSTIYDTNYISLASGLKNLIRENSLQKTYDIVRNEPFLQTEFYLKNNDQNYNESSNRYHQAGYDSFITGCCFVQMIRYRCAQESNQNITNLLDNEIIFQYNNRIFIYGNYDIKFLNLEGNDQKLQRNHIFHLKFPKSFSRNDLNLIFSEFGGLAKIVWLDEESAFCILKDENKSAQVIESLIINPKGFKYAFKVQHYSDYMKNSSSSGHKSPKSISRSNTKVDHLDHLSSKSSTIQQNPTKKIKFDSSSLKTNQKKLGKVVDKLFEDVFWTTIHGSNK